MYDFTNPKYEDLIKWINNHKEHGDTWEQIKYACKGNVEELREFLEIKKIDDFWDISNENEWFELVDFQKEEKEKSIKAEEIERQSVILSDGEINDLRLPTSEGSSWVQYKNKLLNEKHFEKKVVDEIERANYEILRHLSTNTQNTTPIKGMVVGNVQSGKTANMIALMAMAADNGWNMFIILTGSIESLRLQTQNRIFNDLKNNGNLSWEILNNPSKKSNMGARLQDLDIDPQFRKRYMTICLKHQNRLKNLIQWLKQDKNKYEKLKILVIEDEADQATINTADVNSTKRRTINKRMVQIVNGLDEKNEPFDVKCQAMNYIGYTATPYGNVLNEKPGEGLYPSSFIATLDVSNEYFGPQQIFGYDNSEDEDLSYQGLDIIREIPAEELVVLKNITEHEDDDIPAGLEKSLCWFLCCVSCMRIWDYKRPISMLIHTSQFTPEHKSIANIISRWFEKNTIKTIIQKCSEVYKYETKRFTKEKFREDYPTYGIIDEDIKSYPAFDEIEKYLQEILQTGLTNIQLGEDDELEYNRGIHLCVDNCKNNGINEEGMHVRLAYPDTDLDYASAFIVIGGATLSRGLTIEGLVSTYFLRTVKQADTLMQMGRWFGYRKGYELLPRIWMTENTRMQFDYLSLMDQELRNEIYNMKVKKIKPSEYGPRISQHPKTSFIRITAKNRMQSATKVEMNYCNSFIQTYLFDDDYDILKHNYDLTDDFLNGLGESDEQNFSNPSAAKNGSKIWFDVDYKKVHKFLKEFKYQRTSDSFSNIEELCQWVEKFIKKKEFNNWNIILASSKNASVDDKLLSRKVQRTRKSYADEDGNDVYIKNKIINIGVLRNPRDLLLDVDADKLDSKLNDKSESNKVNLARVRDDALPTTPQLIIYCIDQNSKAKDNHNRRDLNTGIDIIGLSVGIPSGRDNTNYTDKVSIKLNETFTNIDVGE